MSSKLSTLLGTNPVTGAQLAQADGLYLYDASATGSARGAAITLAELVKALRTRAASANSTGDTTVTVHELGLIHTEVITFTGSGSTTRRVILAIPTGLSAGARAAIRCILPATADITVDLRNATSGGTQITSLVTDGSGDDAVIECEFDGTAWQFLRATIPANA
jgi:hypothetical protein